ncbi:MAG TPA: hypothetical protein VKG01_01900 [Thermoanaerobaculia bacterium]|nr:hypothetical protein [Thermoanaerobaculia bacterium]
MKTVVGIFRSASAADRAAATLVREGIPPSRIRQLTPKSPEQQIHSTIPTSETEQAGMGRALGAVVGGVLGAWLVLAVIAVGGKPTVSLTGTSYFLAAAVAAAGAIAGAFAGGALEDRMSRGLPKDEIYFYEEALRRGRSVVFVFATNAKQEDRVRGALGTAGADSLDAGDESWKVGIRTPENVHGSGRQAS